MMADQKLFQKCLDQAKLALSEKEVAIGCIFYHRELDQIVASGRNSVNATKNATRHAELNCIDEALEICSMKRMVQSEFWHQIDVYVTCEPCIMCARILRGLQVNKVYYGCSNERFGGCKSVINVMNEPSLEGKTLEFVAGIRQQETIDLLRTFYQGENLNAPLELRKVKRLKSE